MKKFLKFFAIPMVVLLSFTSIYSHDLWLVPQKFMLKPGEMLTTMGNTGMDFPIEIFFRNKI